ncbi:MAG TPA: hypothetical protein VFR09_08620, partial [Alphaproteobacteria bacterium]|nr:hypothetical protein [Alphaproteobacteria bacterium]
DYPITQRIRKTLAGKEIKPGILYEWNVSNDWWFEAVLIKHGMVALAPTPSMARNVDEVGMHDAPMMHATMLDPSFDWRGFVARLDARRENSDAPHIFAAIDAQKTGTSST